MKTLNDRDLNNRESALTTAALAGIDEPGSASSTAENPIVDDQQTSLRTSTLASSVSAENKAEPDYQATPLFSPSEATDFRARWDAVQVGFVDEPRHAVEEADGLVAAAMKRLAEIFAEERARLDGQWDRGDSVSTEDLRLALRRYRSFFGRLLSI